ncbi:hypothetical protein L804_06632 [Cryptococcus deuterogattii 2001/935-1]|nr:hypothetical protein I352_06218 [Cryptococcus deuterogattii MMRL2647]KIR96138.1 hypothetical protein L804_06632 [Cryptococcus deuterogattii 2001/935-1]
MASERTYQLAVHAWNTYHDTVAIQSNTGVAIAFFPVPFIRNGGDNTWRYVLQVVNQLVESHAPHIGVIKNLEGEVLDSEAAPLSGTYVYEQTGCTLPLKFSRGPEYFTAVRAANTEGSSTRSRSSRSTVNQSAFLINLIARDTVCLVTGVHYAQCESVHIVPQSRPDIYQALLNIPASIPPPLFEVQFGLLLRKELHHAWDRLDFSFFVKDDDIFVHVFTGGFFEYHGKRITLDRFHGFPEWRPDRRFLTWHYSQCVKAHIRGFSYGMVQVRDPV